jgi:hypothetical protein
MSEAFRYRLSCGHILERSAPQPWPLGVTTICDDEDCEGMWRGVVEVLEWS